MKAVRFLLSGRLRWDVAGVIVIAAIGRSASLNAIGSQIGKAFVRNTIPQTRSSAFRSRDCPGLQAGPHAWESAICGCTQAVLYAIRSGLRALYPGPLGLPVHPSWLVGWTNGTAGVDGLDLLHAHARR